MVDTGRGAAARLRKTFRYPTDDSSSSTPEVLDEEEQENLIHSLAEENEARNGQFRRAMLALPLLSALPYVLVLARRPGAGLALPSLLGLTSLASTAWLLYVQPPTETGFAALDSWARAGSDSSRGDDSRPSPSAATTPPLPLPPRRRRLSSFSVAARARAHRSPLEVHLPLLNAGLCAVLLLLGLPAAVAAARPGTDPLSRTMLACLPAVVYGVTVAAKLMMASVDPERDLSALRYGNKGA